MDDPSAYIVEKTIGNTVYIVENVFSKNARETVHEKVKRLILNDTESDQNQPNLA